MGALMRWKGFSFLIETITPFANEQVEEEEEEEESFSSSATCVICRPQHIFHSADNIY